MVSIAPNATVISALDPHLNLLAPVDFSRNDFGMTNILSSPGWVRPTSVLLSKARHVRRKTKGLEKKSRNRTERRAF